MSGMLTMYRDYARARAIQKFRHMAWRKLQGDCRYGHPSGNRSEAISNRLRNTLAAAAWGRQQDGSFVTHRRTSIGGPICVELWQGRAALAELYLGQFTIHAREDAFAKAEALRATARSSSERYKTRLAEAVQALVAGRHLFYQDGQQYGTFTVPTGEYVSARGALRAAGLSAERAIDILCEAHDGDRVGIDGVWRPDEPAPWVVAVSPRARLVLGEWG